jgi:phosphatidylglycerol lysyltransferase
VTDPRRPRWKVALGVVASIAIASLAAYVLFRTFERISVADVLRSMRATPMQLLLLASACAAGAFLTLAVYEIAVVRYVKHCIGPARPMLTAFIAFPLGHAIGQAVLSGGALRYRMYSPAGFSATEVGATVLMAGLPYLLAFGLLFDLALVFGAERLAPLFRLSSGWLLALGLLGLAKDLGYLAFVRLRKAPIRLGGWAVRVPSLGMTALQILVGTLDIVLVSSVLYLLLPDSAAIAFLPFVAVYLASVLVGVLSHVPAGLGVLESMLLLLLPHVPPAELLAAVLLYRVIYEIVPVLLALALWGTFELGSQHGAWRRLLRR